MRFLQRLNEDSVERWLDMGLHWIEASGSEWRADSPEAERDGCIVDWRLGWMSLVIYCCLVSMYGLDVRYVLMHP